MRAYVLNRPLMIVVDDDGEVYILPIGDNTYRELRNRGVPTVVEGEREVYTLLLDIYDVPSCTLDARTILKLLRTLFVSQRWDEPRVRKIVQYFKNVVNSICSAR